LLGNNSGWVDAHGHLVSSKLSSQEREALIESALQKGCHFFIQGGIGPEDWQKQRELAAQFPGLIGVTIGLHPEWVTDASDAELQAGLAAFTLEARAASDITAWGELGLHFSPDDSPELRARQEGAFLQCLQTLRDSARPEPIVLHGVRAQGRLLELWDQVFPPGSQRAGMVHSFSGSFEAAQEWMKRGLLISPSPGLARTRGHETLKRAVTRIPKDWLVFESDCPDQSPARDQDPHALGAPTDVLRVAEALARLRGGPDGPHAEDWLLQSVQNLQRVGFRLPFPSTHARET
jgi:TatD DNase family protein